MSDVVYVMLYKQNEQYNIIYVDTCTNTVTDDFFTKNDKFSCWCEQAGNKENIYLAILSHPDKIQSKIASKIISKYNPICNL